LAEVKGYEAYGKMTKTYAKMNEAAARQKATEFYVRIQIVGTPTTASSRSRNCAG